jgi:hypothetical protein
MMAAEPLHPILESDSDPPGQWEHGIVSGSLGITYDLPLGVGLEDRDPPDIDEKVALVLDIKDGDHVSHGETASHSSSTDERGEPDDPLELDVDVWVCTYPADRILQNYMNDAELLFECDGVLEACEKADRWMATHSGVAIDEAE